MIKTGLPTGVVNGYHIGQGPSVFKRLVDLSGTQRLDGEIIVQLDGTNCMNGKSFDELLALLDTNYPASGWSAPLLNKRLQIGIIEGRECQAANGTYVLNPQMVSASYPNHVYQGLSSSIIKEYPRTTTDITHFNGVTVGGNNYFGCVRDLLSSQRQAL